MSERIEQHVAALRLGIEVVSLVDNMPDFVRPLVKDFKVVDTMDYDFSVKHAIDLHTIHNFCGVVNWSEKDVPLRNIIAHKLNLPHMDLDSIAKCRDKVEMRRALSAIPDICPRFSAISSKADLEIALHTVGFPSVLKPAAGSASRGIFIVKNKHELYKAFNKLQTIALESFDPIFTGYSRKLILEEFLNGREFSVEGYVSAGKISIVGITDKWVSKNFCIERCHIYPSNLEYSIKNHIIEKTKAVINILGIDNSPFHLEAKLTSDGFKIIECAARAAGDSITTHIIPLSLAVSHVENCLLASMGQEIQSLKRPNYHAAVLFIFATQAGILSSIKGLEQVIQHPVVVSCKMHCSIGDKLSIPPEEFLNHRVLTIFLRDYEYLNIINTVKWIEKTVDVKIN